MTNGHKCRGFISLIKKRGMQIKIPDEIRTVILAKNSISIEISDIVLQKMLYTYHARD